MALQRFHDLVLDLVREDLARVQKGGAKEPTVRFVGGAFLELLSWWLESKSLLAPEELARIFVRMAGPALTAA